MYKNIRQRKKSVAPLQKLENKEIKKQKRGRPRRENMARFSIKMDKILHQKIRLVAKELGTSNSFIISEGARKYLKEYKNHT